MKITITHDGKISTDLINKSENIKDKDIVKPDNILYMLGANVELDEGFKVKHLFEVLKNYPRLMEINPYIIHFYKDFMEETEPKQSELDGIIIQRLFSNTSYDNSYENYIEITGRNINPPEDVSHDTRWSCSFLGLKELKEAEIILAPGSYVKNYGRNSKKYKSP